MKAIISDIHGNYIALQAVLKSIDEQGADEIYCLGDIVGYYSQVNECCEELRKRNVKCILGNHDWYMVCGIQCERSKSVNDCLAYQKKALTEENLVWLRSLPITIIRDDFFMVHGGWKNPIDEYLNPSEEYFKSFSDGIFFSGHTHKAIVQQVREGILYCNPGSVGQPRDGDNRASYALFDRGRCNIFRIPYDYKIVGELMEKAGFSSYYYGCLYDGSKNLHSL